MQNEPTPFEDQTQQFSAAGSDFVDLADLDEEYSQAEIQEDSFDTVPDGKYQVQVMKAELTLAKTTQARMLKWHLKILGPTNVGRYLFKNSMLSPKSLTYVKTDLHRCGVDLEKMSELQNRLNELLDLILEVRKKTKDDNENVYIDKRIEVLASDQTLTPF